MSEIHDHTHPHHLATERDEASKALTRAMFLTTGRTDLPRS